MEKSKTTAIVATVVAALLCGCPGLFGLCWGAIGLIVGFIPGAEIDIFGSSDPTTAMLTGLGAICGGIIFIAIPIVVGVLMFRKKSAPAPEPVSEEPLPPTA